MPDILSVAGLTVALAGAPVVLALSRVFGLKKMSWAERLSLWVAAALGVALSIQLQGGVSAGLSAIGLAPLSTASLLWGLAGALAIFLAGGLTMALQRLAGLPVGDQATFDSIATLPLARRIFIVLTAAAVEEVLYRGCAISFGAAVLGGSVPAALLSLAAFTLAHFRWRPSHLISVLVAGSVLTALYLHTHDLWACILAHLIVDAVGLLLMPALIGLRKKRKAAAQHA